MQLDGFLHAVHPVDQEQGAGGLLVEEGQPATPGDLVDAGRNVVPAVAGELERVALAERRVAFGRKRPAVLAEACTQRLADERPHEHVGLEPVANVQPLRARRQLRHDVLPRSLVDDHACRGGGALSATQERANEELVDGPVARGILVHVGDSLAARLEQRGELGALEEGAP